MLGKVKKEGGDESAVFVMQQNCQHHMRNVWFGAIVKCISSFLNKLLACNLKEIDFRYRISTLMDTVLRAIDKEFILLASYPKRHRAQFKH